MKKLICLFVLISSINSVRAIDIKLAAVPDSLLRYANVVKQSEERSFVVNEKNRATYKVKVSYTILNKEADKWAILQEYYDKLTSLEYIKGTLYDANGKEIRSIKKGDIKDFSANTVNFMDDYRIKEAAFYHKGYPYTVEFEFEQRYKGTMFMPSWHPQESFDMSVLNASYSVSVPTSNKLNYKFFASEVKPVITTNKSNTVYTWTVKNVPAFKTYYASPSSRELTPSLYLATEKFMLEDYEGSNASWKEFGKFIHDMTKDRDALPADVKQKVAEIVSTCKTVKEKIEKLYRFMQQNTRYVSIQLGIGGWQPFDATYVASRKYGDCKALSNYMYALLKEAGIRSNYTLISSNRPNNYLIEDLPSSQFNHAILMVPIGKDTTWLECTSQTLAPGYLSGSTANRWALAIDETGGTLVRTPSYTKDDNLQIRNTQAKIDENGLLKATVQTYYKAVQQDNLHQYINGLARDKLKEYLMSNLDLPSFDISDFSYEEIMDGLPVVKEKIEFVAPNYATTSGKRVFVTPNLLTRSGRKLSNDAERKTDIVLGFGYIDIDTVIVELPAAYAMESTMKPVQIESEFGSYSSQVEMKSNQIIYTRRMEHFEGRYPGSAYPNLVKFYEDVYKADRSRLVMLKEPTTEEKKGF